MRPEPPAPALRVFFYVQHLLGIGHLHRAAGIVRALSTDGFHVQLVLGGPATPSLDVGQAEIIPLPPVKAGPEGFAKLVHPDGRIFTAVDEQARRDRLIACFDRFAPDVLITEAFPFGRRQMRFELLPLLEHARARPRPPLIAASVRDILQRGKSPERADETVALVGRFYDLLLVHGDPSIARLEDSFPDASAFAEKIVYTGIVAPDARGMVKRPRTLGAVVSVGGGAVGAGLIAAALAARPMTRIADAPWLVITGPNLPSDLMAALQARHQTNGVAFERFVPDLAGVLSGAGVSVSQAGYNTVADILAAGCRSVLIPYAREGETEQTDRAALLAARGLAVAVAEEGLRPAALAAAIDHALVTPRAHAGFDLDGARATGRILRRAVADRTGPDTASRSPDRPRSI